MSEPPEELIEIKAHQIWEKRQLDGREGTSQSDWEEAKQYLKEHQCEIFLWRVNRPFIWLEKRILDYWSVLKLRPIIKAFLLSLKKETPLLISSVTAVSSGLIVWHLTSPISTEDSNDGLLVIDIPCLEKVEIHTTFDLSQQRPFIRIGIFPERDDKRWWLADMSDCPYIGINGT